MNKLHLNNLFWFGLLITVLSVLINLLFFALTQALGEQYIIPFTESTANAAPMPVLMVVIATAIPALLAVLLYGFLSKFTPKAILPSFLSVAITALLVSFGGPFDLPGAILRTKLLLSSMHMIAAIIIIGGLMLYHTQNKKKQVEQIK
jgi:hypothetical protein